MSEPYVGEIRMFGFNFAPRGWAFCDGQLLAISQNTALFSLLGTTYGGDGRTTFALPELRGRVPVHVGSGPGLSGRSLGERSGVENVTLTVNQLPAHSHALKATGNPADTGSPADNVLAMANIYTDDPVSLNLRADSIGDVGGAQAHTNMQPFMVVSFCIALVGIFPSRS